MSRFKNILPAFLALLLLSMNGCMDNGKNETKNKKIIFGVSPFPDTEMPLLGKIKGWYAQEGLEVEFKTLGWTEVQEALSSSSSNKIDIGINNISAVVATHTKNPELVYYYGFNTFDNGFALMIRKDGKIKPLDFFLKQGQPLNVAIRNCSAQLKGKTVVTTSNTDMEQGVAACARKGGLNFMKDIKIIDLNPDDGLAAFLQGTGDAYIGGIPQRTKAGEQGMVEMITGSDLGPAPINGIVTTKKFAKENAESLSKILKVWFKIVQYTDAHLDEVAKTMVAQLNKNTAAGVTPEQFKTFWNHYEHYPSSPDAIDSAILSPSGKNYWKARWDDCNYYFYNIKKTIAAPVLADSAFLMIQAQKDLKALIASK